LINGVRYSANGVAPTPGSWSTFTATYTGIAADVGDPITIELGSTTTGFPTQAVQADFDDVRLSNNAAPPPIPEPSSIGLLGAALIGVVAFARRKHHIRWCAVGFMLSIGTSSRN
jgi:PEP-CTERM motif